MSVGHSRAYTPSDLSAGTGVHHMDASVGGLSILIFPVLQSKVSLKMPSTLSQVDRKTLNTITGQVIQLTARDMMALWRLYVKVRIQERVSRRSYFDVCYRCSRRPAPAQNTILSMPLKQNIYSAERRQTGIDCCPCYAQWSSRNSQAFNRRSALTGFIMLSVQKKLSVLDVSRALFD